jgi:cytochrome c
MFVKGYFISALSIACGGSGSNKTEKEKPAVTDITKHPDYQAGLSLVAKNRCLTCHAIDQLVTGPAYREIANKYASYPDTIVSHLAKKVIHGGNGVWGQVYMTPNNVTQEDAETMVRYILLLKK